jgi:anti-sigma B factor antagonist
VAIGLPIHKRPLKACRRLAGKEPIPLLRNHTESGDTAEIHLIANAGGALACLSGRIDMDSSPAVRDRLLALLRSANASLVTVDLSAVTDIDSSGVATLIEALKVARGHRTELRLQGLQDRVLRLFECTGILALFNGASEHEPI